MRDHFLGFLIKKILEVVASLVTLAALTFFLLKSLPGGPFDEDVALNPLVKEKLIEHWNVQQPVVGQIGSYLGAFFRGDLGVSMVRPDRTVFEIIASGLGNTLTLNLAAICFIIIGALLISLFAVRFQGSWVESLIDQALMAFLSLPSLFWGPLLIYFFGFYLNLLPVALLSSPLHYVLPLATLSLRPLATLVRLLKNSLIENMYQDYVRTARAKGLGAWHILLKHILRNSLIPFISYLGPLLVSLLSGSFLVEVLFAIPGLGTEFISALNDRDYTLVVGLTLFYGSSLIIINSLLDILLKAVDPRLREPA